MMAGPRCQNSTQGGVGTCSPRSKSSSKILGLVRMLTSLYDNIFKRLRIAATDRVQRRYLSYLGRQRWAVPEVYDARGNRLQVLEFTVRRPAQSGLLDD